MIYGYISKRVRIEAFRWGSFDSWPKWLWSAHDAKPKELGALWEEKRGRWFLRTKSGVHEVNDGDYIVYVAPDDIYPCPAAVFEAQYEPEEPAKAFPETQRAHIGETHKGPPRC